MWLLAWAASFSTPIDAITLTFEDGTTGSSASAFYSTEGIILPNWRFHDATVSGNEPFPFIDGKGVVIDFGVFNTTTGFIEFPVPATDLQITALLESNGNLGSWNLRAYDSENREIGFSETIVQSSDRYSLSTLSVAAPAGISRIEVNRDFVIGVDSITFSISRVPDAGSSLAFLAFALATFRIFSAPTNPHRQKG